MMMWTGLITVWFAQIGSVEMSACSAPAVLPSVTHAPVFVDTARPIHFSEFSQPKPFGTGDTWRWQIHGGFGLDIDTSDNMLGLVGLGVSYFVIDDLSIDAELNGLYVSQRHADAVAGNFNLLLRWHFLSEATWSLYGEVGAGILLSTEDVPFNGSQFNFTPQAGFGASFDIGGDARLMTGLRWHHISNASLYSSNPGRDSILGYVGVSFGF